MTPFLIFITLLSASALASAAETAFFSLSHAEIRLLEKRGEKNAKLVAKLRQEPQRLLITILLVNAFVNTALASYAAIVASEFFPDSAVGLAASVAAGVTATLILIVGEIFPKSLAITHKHRVALLLSPFFAGTVFVTAPIGRSLLWVERTVMRVFGGDKKQLISEEEVRAVAELGLEQGGIDHREHAMIERIFRFDDTAVSEIMTHLDKVSMLDGRSGIDNLAYFAAHEGYSRYPVYVDGRENIIGYVHVNDILRALNSDNRDRDLSTITQPITHIADSMKLEQAFILMGRERSHLFMVHKAHRPGYLVGLVTMEDLIEQIVGEIEDEGDRRELFGVHTRPVI
jgi:putative hemolysin